MTKISDVAEKTGYSITTISRAINDHPYVSDKTKKKIFDAMKELDYYPNNVAQQLRGKGTKLIGVIISFVINPFFTYLVDAIEKAAYQVGYQIVILQTLEEPEREKKFIEMLKKRQLDGLIMTSLDDDSPEVLKLIEAGKIVVCNRYLGEQNIPLIHVDEKKATYEATYYLLSKGHRKIGYVTGNRGSMLPVDPRFEGYVQALKEFDIEPNSNYIFPRRLTISDGKSTLTDVLALGEERPDALLVISDEVASGILSQCHLLNIKVPETLAIIGFDDQPIAEALYPGLTTVRQPIKEMGEYVAALIIANIEHREHPERPELNTKLIIRGTA
ncbi:MAG: LacI family DNA-binding transcriptional regulator [Lactococcus raffinolactis]|jgi:DNA-binding LacI/PurR family transcriptional regulator|uniref:LacI family DNA-binding transcriptional regulator n=1 Tax=Pseudolactococcus raffinolactis TaxID=1366 RepID=UPI000BB4FA23|nr:LacI family DNA-binding transcriptional regulator [Lactococcus raffinolactis]MBP6300846.1 LacI family DNA-binding transcriptional regulator [Lactococcus sp.]ATC61876.1 transcriptional regulator [Lactococcus raffinolactis]MBP6984067.1 LacI family DNA-binding transcriptional regulator [Lactococcus sp.]MBR2542834.1 LacI family DNA-binding transcriptional regulator [Lactococcus sp.]MDN5415655.1 LacI family transcriptional regulator [Lactococcus raffinolactis]